MKQTHHATPPFLFHFPVSPAISCSEMVEILPAQIGGAKNETAGGDAVEEGKKKKAIPKGVVLDKDGKP